MIATSVEGIPGMTENRVNGILVEADNPRGLANAILLLLDDDLLRRKLATSARPVLISRYYQDRITVKKALMQLY